MRYSSMGLLFFVLLTGCSSLKGWFTTEGQKVSLGRTLSAEGKPHRASVLAEEALSIDGTYTEARDLLARTFAPGQDEFQAETGRWQASDAADRWDHLTDLFQDQASLARLGPTLGPVVDPVTGLGLNLVVAPVDAPLAEARRQAAQYHWDGAQTLLDAAPGPRQARKALAEVRTAVRFDPQLPGLEAWLASVQDWATQRVLVVPFFWEPGSRVTPTPAALGSVLSRRLIEGQGLPELTTVFSSDRLVTLPGGGPARVGLVSLPDAKALAVAAGQNLVLMGQVTLSVYREPRSTVGQETRERQVVLVDPAHPQGIPKVFKATVTTTETSTSLALTASFSLTEVETGLDVVTAVRDAEVSDRVVVTTFTGDREALEPSDLEALKVKGVVASPEVLRDRVIEALAAQVAEVVRDALR